jgi:hypothetical protein
MEWVILEALVALALGLFIVWWTLSPARRHDREGEARETPARRSGSSNADRDVDGRNGKQRPGR